MNESTFIVIPAYNEEQVIGPVVSGVRRAWPTVVVVDDGSSDHTAEAALRAGAIVLHHAVNRGQGAALQTGIAFALSKGAAEIVTFDSDGQHRPEDIDSLLAPIRSGTAAIVLGSRFLGSAESMPWMRRILLRAAILFTRITSGARVTDTHNGLRAFSRAAATRINIQLDRMAHASELLDQIVSSGLPFVEVPVHLVYSDYSRRKGQSAAGAFRVVFDYLWRRWTR